ncbi:MAG: hypothetical protein EZS28_011346 [Streblomastix strix]|uniref:SPRY domain-containing protein n=1 Tax=Streblomastix strix TaxID=222440 RepID=A0A5J4WEH1_9EUKA|nr:MAG: hypothetical protein EZS28_011346 [Streblomastix strix]
MNNYPPQPPSKNSNNRSLQMFNGSQPQAGYIMQTGNISPKQQTPRQQQQQISPAVSPKRRSPSPNINNSPQITGRSKTPNYNIRQLSSPLAYQSYVPQDGQDNSGFGGANNNNSARQYLFNQQFGGSQQQLQPIRSRDRRHRARNYRRTKCNYRVSGNQVDIERTDQDTFTHTLENSFPTVVLFDPVITSGIARFEVINVRFLLGVGIADESMHYGQNEWPSAKGKDMMIQYRNEGWIAHLGDEKIEGNEKFIAANDVVKLELNMVSQPKTLTFFVNGIQQKNYVVNIPRAVRFWAFLWQKGSSFQISKFDILPVTAVRHKDKMYRQWKYGKKWKNQDEKHNCVIQ